MGGLNPRPHDPSNLEPFNGNFVGAYGSGTWLWNGTTQSWSQLTPSVPNLLKACGNNLLWASAADGTWRWNATAGWAQLTGSSPESMECLGGDAVWEGAAGTWLYSFTTGWSQIKAANPTGVLACGSRLVWWRAGDSVVLGGRHGVAPPDACGPRNHCLLRRTTCVGRRRRARGSTTSRRRRGRRLTSATPTKYCRGVRISSGKAPLALGFGMGRGGHRSPLATPPVIEVLGADLLWSFPAGTWVWSGAGGGTGWTNITSGAATEIVSTGQVKYPPARAVRRTLGRTAAYTRRGPGPLRYN